MIEVKDVTPGRYVWWEAERMTNAWSCPCIIVEAKKRWFRVKSLDNFKETGKLRMYDSIDPTSRREMRIATAEEVRQFLSTRRRRLKEESAEVRLQLNQELKEARERLREHDQEVKAILSDLTP